MTAYRDLAARAENVGQKQPRDPALGPRVVRVRPMRIGGIARTRLITTGGA